MPGAKALDEARSTFSRSREKVGAVDRLVPLSRPSAKAEGPLARKGEGSRASSPSHITKLIPSQKSSLTLRLAALHGGTGIATGAFFGKGGRRRAKRPGDFCRGVPGRVHPGREPLRDVASLNLRRHETPEEQEWTSRVSQNAARGADEAPHTKSQRCFASAPLPLRRDDPAL